MTIFEPDDPSLGYLGEDGTWYGGRWCVPEPEADKEANGPEAGS